MKNVFKKIAATAMALTLIGAGTAITNTISPQTNNTLTAVAACRHRNQYNGQVLIGYVTIHNRKVPFYAQCRRCSSCGAILYWL